MKTKKQAPSIDTNSVQSSVALAREEQVQDLQTRLTRALADYQNLEKRYERDSASVIKFANSTILERLLDIRDHLDAAANHLKDPSLTMILSSVDKLLSEESVSPVDTSGFFDPAIMECQETVPGDDNKVISVTRPGYRLYDRILRPARVTVGDGTPSGPGPVGLQVK